MQKFIAGLMFTFSLGLAPAFGADSLVDYILVLKSQHRMYLIKNQEVLSSYSVSFGANPLGHKVQEGDERTPEGNYRILEKRTQSQFYKALWISYPDAKDKARAKDLGVNPGGLIMIHGLPNNLAQVPGFLQQLHRYWNWTDGCIAVTNQEMDEIFALVSTGTPIYIRP